VIPEECTNEMERFPPLLEKQEEVTGSKRKIGQTKPRQDHASSNMYSFIKGSGTRRRVFTAIEGGKKYPGNKSFGGPALGARKLGKPSHPHICFCKKNSEK